MKKTLGITLVAASLLSGCSKETPAPAPVTAPPPKPAAAIDVPAPSVLGSAPREITPMEQSQAAYLTLQLQEYSAKHGKVPTDLGELVAAKMLPKMPVAPQGFRYEIDAKNRQVVLVRQ